jgi:predicted MFS family arabinose efflux permease
VAPAIVPVLYAVAMGAASLAAVAFGRLYDRYSLRGLLVLPFLAALVPALSFSDNPVAFTVGALVWGAAMGVHESTMRAAVADFVPAHRRGAAYGTFTAVYGLAWLGGAALIGALYDQGVGVVTAFVGGVQVVALVLIVTLLRRMRPPADQPAALR